MQNKDYNRMIFDEIKRSFKVISEVYGVNFEFFENESLVLEKDELGKKKMGYGLVVEVQIPLPDVEDQPKNRIQIKKLFARNYDLNGLKLTDVRTQAYRELMDVVFATFLVTAEKATRETLKAVSHPEQNVLNTGEGQEVPA